MASKWYGNIINRILENGETPEIVVGMGVTECYWSDREPYEVIAVKDQKHVTIRRLDHKPTKDALPYSNDWELFSDESATPQDICKRGKYWYSPYKSTGADGKEHTYYRKRNLCFGYASYYYDYSF